VAAELGHEVVQGAEAGSLEAGIFQPEETEAQRRGDDFTVEAVLVLVEQSRGRVPAAGERFVVADTGLSAALFVRRAGGAQADRNGVGWEALVNKEVVHPTLPLELLDARGAVPVFLVDALRPEVTRVRQVRVC